MKAIMLLISLSIFFSCSNVKSRKGEINIKLYATIAYDTIKSRSFLIITQEMENSSNVNYYTYQPGIVIYDAKHNFNYNKFQSELTSEGPGTGLFDRYIAHSYYKFDSSLIKEITKEGAEEIPSEQLQNSVIIDSFVKFTNASRKFMLDSTHYYFENNKWLFIPAHFKQQKYYTLELKDLFSDKVNAIKIRTIHPFEKSLFSINNAIKESLPKVFFNYKFYDDIVNIDSIYIPVKFLIF